MIWYKALACGIMSGPNVTSQHDGMSSYDHVTWAKGLKNTIYQYFCTLNTRPITSCILTFTLFEKENPSVLKKISSYYIFCNPPHILYVRSTSLNNIATYILFRKVCTFRPINNLSLTPQVLYISLSKHCVQTTGLLSCISKEMPGFREPVEHWKVTLVQVSIALHVALFCGFRQPYHYISVCYM